MVNKIFPNGWKMTTLGKVAVLNYGKGLRTENRLSGDIPVYGSSGITGLHNKAFVNEEGYIIGRKGTVGSIYYSPLPFFPIDTVYYLTRNDIQSDFNYFYYLLKTLGLDKLNFDSAVPGLNREMAYSLPIIIPEDKEEQRAIARVLSSFDDKIELLREQNKTLEATAQAIFKEWFVKFNFPNDEGKPYKDSGGKMVNSEFGEIPEGWKVGRLEEIIRIQNGYAFKSEDYVTNGVSIVRTTNFNNGSIVMNDVVYLTKEKAREYEKFYIESYDFLLVMVGASIGKSVIVPSYILPALQNQNMWNFKPKKNNMKFYNILFLKKLVEQQLNSASGSARDFFRKDYFYSLEVIIPNKELLVIFDHIMSKLYAKIDSNYIQIQTLSAIRDILLPKLMRGELRVKF